MSEEFPLDEALQLEQRGYPLFGNSALPVTRPTAAGLQWLAVPSDCVGLAYRIQGGTILEAIMFAPDPHVRLRSLEISAPVAHLTCSSDGRLVVAACIDGSLQCMNATSSSLELRWIIRNAHSHIVQDVSAAVSSSRDYAASKAGPIHSLAFAPSGYALLLADAGKQMLSIYDAESSDPVNLFRNQTQVLCAAWSTETSNDGEYPFALGCVDGSIDVMTFSMLSGGANNISTIPALEDEEKLGFVCTHLDWFNNGKCLAAGYCRVAPSDDAEDQDEDDSADHEAMLYVGPMENYQWYRAEVGDVVPFFSVPRNGRHVFFTSFCPSNRDTPLLLVASNVASDVGVVAPDSGEWQVTDLQEGCGASTPTDEDDEFTFPMGIATVRLPDASFTSQALLLASTDGSLSVFHIINQNNSEAFRTPHTSIVHGIASLPAEPLEMILRSPPTPPLSPEREEIDTTKKIVAPAEDTPVFGSGSASGLSFGTGAAPSFGSPALGQPSTLGVGTSPSTPFSFGKTDTSAPSLFRSPAFGQPSTLGLGTTPSQPFSFGNQGSSASGSPAAPLGSPSTTAPFGSGGSVPIFGSTSSSGGGFAALAASPAVGFGTSSGPSPFDAFSKSSKSFAGSVPSSMVKPLFGDSTAQSSATKKTEEESAPTPAAQSIPEEAPPELADETATSDEPGAKNAARVFDSFDKEKAGTLPLDKFEDMLDELGEGFHGEELELQMAIIDPEGTNQVGRSAFISWYMNLLAGDGSGEDGDGDGSMDSGEREEQAEEKAKAEGAFASLATTGEAGKPAIAKGDFGKLMEAMGTTYCEEEHRKTVKKLTKSDGMIYGVDFTEWYIDWLFGEGDDDEEESVDSNESYGEAEAGQAAGGGEEPVSSSSGGWGSIFATSQDTWKCDSCMVRNDASVTVCVACETPKPGHAAPAAPVSESLTASGLATIGVGGFTFGGGATSAPVEPASEASTASGFESIDSSGFAFGGGATLAPVAPASEQSAASGLASIGTGGFTFGGGGAPTDGFSFGSSAVGKSDTKAASSGTVSVSGFSLGAAKVEAKTEEDTESKPSDPSGYPPLSLKAPTPFGGGKTSAPASSESVGSSSYPPMSSKAPVPFDSGAASKISTSAKSMASSTYPPIASTAPAPFGGIMTSAPAPSKPVGVSSYPPMSSVGPIPFGGGKSSVIGSTKSSALSGYSPIFSTAPTPFGGTKTSAPAPSKSVESSSYPPMSSKAPVPFGSGGAMKTSTSAKSMASSAYPPISSTAPTPFGGVTTSAPAPSKAVGVSLYPPMSSVAPIPFGGGKSSQIGSTKSSALSACPPISSMASTPFGGTKASAPVLPAPSKPAGASSFPPMSSKAPMPFGAPSSSEPIHSVTTTSVPSGTKPPSSASLPFSKPATSDYESHFSKVIEQFRASISLLADNRLLPDSLPPSAGVGSDFEGRIENLVEQTDFVSAACGDLHVRIANEKERSIFLLSRKTDIERQSEESRRLIDAQTASRASQSHIMQTQPLDAESERFRRSLAVKALMVNRASESIENRISTLRGICDIRDDYVTDAPVAVSRQDRKHILFGALTSSFQRTQRFKENAANRACEVRSYAATIPPAVHAGASLTPLSQACSPHMSINGRTSKHRLTPVPLHMSGSQSHTRSSSRQVPCEGMEKWAKIEQAMRETRVRIVPSRKLTRLARIGSSSANSVSIVQGRRMAALRPSLLLSPAGTESVSRSIRGDSSGRGPLVFSSPESRPRSEWNARSDIDQAKVKAISMTFPERLKEVSAMEAAREALAGFGTTPEKAERAIELRKNARITEPSRTPTQSKTPAEKFSRSSTSSAAFPPVSANAPTPFSLGMNTADKGREAKYSSPYPPVAKQTPQPLLASISNAPSAASSTNVGEVRRTSKEAVSLQPKAAESAVGNFKGLGDSLFAEGSKTSAKSDFGFSGASSVVGDVEGVKPEPDFHDILTEFYKTHNPAKLIEVDITLEKYKGREVEMFAKLARKYKVSSPLDSIGKTGEPSVSAPVGAAPLPFKTAVPPMPSFGSMAGLDSGITPSFGASKPQAYPSPFGSTIEKSNPIGQSPFGQPLTNTFGSMTPSSPSPFGQPSTQTASSLGGAPQAASPSSPSPFGPPSTQTTSSFGGAPQLALPSSTSILIGGREPREVLVAFYQKYNPSKLHEIDKVLTKYKNDEELLFRNLAKKYNLDPELFGLPSNPQQSGFGLAGPGSTQGGFGQTTPFGGSVSSGFGSSLGSGQPASSFGSTSGGSMFGSPSVIGGNAFGSSSVMGGGQAATFGSLASPGASALPFGGGTQTGGFGSMSGSGGFGIAFGGASATPFGAPRR